MKKHLLRFWAFAMCLMATSPLMADDGTLYTWDFTSSSSACTKVGGGQGSSYSYPSAENADVTLEVDATNGKFNPRGGDVQVNATTIIKVPVKAKGDVITIYNYRNGANGVTYTIGGETKTATDVTYEYTVGSKVEASAGFVTITVTGSGYMDKFTVLQHEPEASGGQTFTNVEGTVTWPIGNESAGTASTEAANAVSAASVSTGNELKVEAAKYFDTDMVKYTPNTSNAGNVEGVMIEYRVKPKSGVTFKPTNVSYDAVKVGTDGATYSWSYTLDGVESTITEVDAATTLRNNGSNSATASLNHSIDIAAEGTNEFTFRFYISKTANNKNICIGNVIIKGIFNGTAADVASYMLTTSVSPAEGGNVSVYPAGNEFEEGTTLKLTATENFGYDFVNWTDAEGNAVSTDEVYSFDIKKNEQLTANFQKVETYALNLTVEGANDYMVTVAPAPEVVDGKWMYEAGQKVVLTANQYEGLVTFNNWNNGTTNSELEITMSEAQNITATYSQADIIAGWDFYKAGNSGRKADFAAQDNDADALNLVNTETGAAASWLDKSTEKGGYESFKGAAVNWTTGSKEGEVGLYHWQTKINAEAFTDIKVQFRMLYNYNAYQTYDAEYSLNGTEWTKFGNITMEGAKNAVSFNETLPAACNNQKEIFIRMIADKTSKVDGASSKNDGNTLAMFFITGTPKLVNDGVAPKLVSSVPANKSTGASASGKIVLTFDERIKAAEGIKATLGDMALTPSISGKVATFEYKGLNYATEYTFTLPAKSIGDLTDNFIAEAITLTFTTLERPTVEKTTYDVTVSNVEELSAAIKAANNRTNKNTRYYIFIKKGTYKLPTGISKHYKHTNTDGTVTYWEGDLPDPITYVTGANISFIGEDRDATIITQDISNSEDMLFTGANGKVHKYEEIKNSAVLQLESSASGTYFQDITIKSGINDALGRNLAVYDKSNKTIYKNTCLYGYQDTWTSDPQNSLFYFEDGVIRGRTDYMCGKGDAYFNRVELRQVQGGYAAVPSVPKAIGWVYKDCVINGDGDGVDGNYTLGRPWGSGTPVAVWIDTKMNVVPSAIGWNEMSGGWPARFAEYNSMTSTGSQIDLSGRKTTFGDGHANNPVLTAEEAAQYSDMSKMFGDWQPTLMTEQAPAPQNVKFNKNGNILFWDGSNYALLYAVCLNGNVIGFTTDTQVDVTTLSGSASAPRRAASAADYTVRAANEMGGLSEASAPATETDGIETIEQAQPVINDGVIYNLQGVRVDKATKGVYIINGKKVVIK